LIYSSSVFHRQIAVITKKPKDGYSKCLSDIASILCPLSFAEICLLDDLVTKAGNRMIRKIRVPNSDTGEGKSSGYRVIVLCDMDAGRAYLLFVYPKKGKLGSPDLTTNGASILLHEFDKVKAAGEKFEPICTSTESIPAVVAEESSVYLPSV
jgi:hypothetical protein